MLYTEVQKHETETDKAEIKSKYTHNYTWSLQHSTLQNQ